MNGGVPDLDEAQRRMEGVGGRIGRVRIDLADDPLVGSGAGGVEQVFVQAMRQPALAHRGGDHDAVDIDEAAIALAEPVVVGAVVVGILVESQEEGGDAADAPRAEGLRQQMPQPCGVEPGELDGMLVVEREDRSLVACGNAGQFGQAFVSFRKRISSRLTSAACSCCTQWPAPSTMWISFMLVQALFCIFTSAPGDW
jgi:hypothetical protein